MNLFTWIPPKSSRARKRHAVERRRALALEPLEQRLLLSSHMFHLRQLLPAFGGDGSAGFVLIGNDPGSPPDGDYSGHSVSSAGDINGDGFDDVLIGAPWADPTAPYSTDGESYVVFGKAGGFAAALDPLALDGTNGFVINGISSFNRSGRSVSSAGDFNGDGFDDLVIGAWGGGPSEAAGASYVVFGKAGPFAASLDLSSLGGTNGFAINGIDTWDNSGWSVSGAGDVNGDGFDDVVIGAPMADPNGLASGESYVVFGKAGPFAASFNLASLGGTNGFVINGIDASDVSGHSVSGAGDLNGDGFDDVVIGAYGANLQAGESYVVFGKGSAFAASLELSTLNGSNGFAINGVGGNDYSGYSVSRAGDVNGDGFDDLIIGAYQADPDSFFQAGESYVVFGKGSGFAASLELSALNGTNGFVINGVWSDDESGFSVGAAGDFNGDGLDDLLIGAPGADPAGNTEAGESYVVYGNASGFGASLNLSSLDGTNGFMLDGVDWFDASGTSVSGAGDVNGDGLDDLVIGAPERNSFAGESYVVFGVGAPGEIRGSKWNDQDGDGVWDPAEPALPGWTIYLDDNNNGVFDAGERSTTTDGSGNYAFTDVAPGTLTVAEVPQGGWEQTFPVASFVVNSTADTVDANPGDGVAQDALGNTTLRAAIMESNAWGGDDVITIGAGTYTFTIGGTDDAAAMGDLDVTDNLTIVGDGPVVINANGLDRVFHVLGGAALNLSGVTVSNGSTLVGAGISNYGTLTLTHSTISGNSAVGVSADGGGLFNAGTLTLINSTVSGNSAVDSGGGIRNNATGTLTISNSTVAGNSAPFGAGIQNGSGTVRVKNTIIAGNSSRDLGGSIFTSEGNNLIGNSNTSGFTDGVNGDQVGSFGSPIDPLLGPLQDNGGPTFTRALLPVSPAIDAGNNAGAPATDQRRMPRMLDGNSDVVAIVDVGAFERDTGSTTFVVNSTADTVDANPGDGVAQDSLGNTTLRAAIMESNAWGGDDVITIGAGTYTFTIGGTDDAAAMGDLDVTDNLTIVGNGPVVINAGGLDRVFHVLGGAALNLSGVTVSNGSTLVGAGISNWGTLTLTHTTISGNSAVGVSADGGGLFNAGTLTLINSTVSGNSAVDSGGGIRNNVTGTLTIINSTLTGNSAPLGGGIWNGNGTVRAKNTIIAGNSSRDLGGITFTSEGNNLIGNGGALGFTDGVNGDQVGSVGIPIDPLLGPLQDNGGPTFTHALLSLSPAMDAGNNAGSPATDQRRMPRLLDGDRDGSAIVDIGAYETAGHPPGTHSVVLEPAGILTAIDFGNWQPPAAGITVTPTSGLSTTEAGGMDVFTVVLDTQPTANVSIGLSSSDVGEGTVWPTSLTFTSANWSTPKSVAVLGVDDLLVDGNVAYTIITAPATSGDANYNGLNPANVSVTNLDDDATIAARHIFYDNSHWDGNTAGPNTGGGPSGNGDDGAIAPDKQVLLPLQTAAFANYTSYSRGINAIMVDVANLANPAGIDAGDFLFRSGNAGPPSGWPAAPAPTSVSVRPGAGPGGSDRVSLFWADNAIANQWLQVTVLANADTGLAQKDVFYFGNLTGDTDGNFVVNIADMYAVYLAMGPGAAIDNRWDIDRNGVVNIADMYAVYLNLNSTLQELTAPAAILQSIDSVFSKNASWAIELMWLDELYGSSADSEEEEEDDLLEATAAEGVSAAYYEE